MSVRSIDKYNKSSHTIITVILASFHTRNPKRISEMKKYRIFHSDEEQVITETTNCTDFNVTIVHKNYETYDEYNNDDIIPTLLFISTDDSCNTYLDLNNMKFRKCPLGFMLNSEGKCACSYAISDSTSHHMHMECSIERKTITRTHQWAGKITVEFPKGSGNTTTTFGISNDFCKYNLLIEAGESVFYMNGSDVYIESFDGKNRRPICYPTRSGPLCGDCAEENGKLTSVMFGSIKCGTCSSAWLWTIPLYAIAGLVLVILLFKLKLTLTNGTLIAVIFYAHVANIGILHTFHYIADESTVMSLLNVFLSMLNLNLGFPLCFFHGMDELWKAGLSLLFPVYLLLIILTIVCVSRFSIRLSNDISQSSVQVCVTVVHLSFVKLLSAITDVFTFTLVYTDIETMSTPLRLWLQDGSVLYGKGHHLILMIATSVIVAMFIVPYFFLLIGGRYLLQFRYFNRYLRPFHEAIHAPYEDSKYYWFTIRLLTITFIYVCYVVWCGTDIHSTYAVVLPALIIFTALHAYARPFKSKLVCYMDLFVNINLCTVLATTWYTAEFYIATIVIIISSAGTVFAMFIGIIAGHILWTNGKLIIIKKMLLTLGNTMKNYWQQKSTHRMSEYTPLNENSSLINSYRNYREPLLSSETQ